MRNTATITRMLLCCGALWAALAAAPLRAQIRIVPRAKLDSLAHPATAAGGAEAMRFERTLIDAGHIGEDDVPRSTPSGGGIRAASRWSSPACRPPAAAPRRAGTKSPSHRAAKAP
ncbi:MAG: hypothetical protein ACLTG8_06075 [Alistipes finegoldii]|uniref:hypothetical protein n=1 Tax=Alistipes finegoldii TaxID=214856 RepID=UPI003995FD1A